VIVGIDAREVRGPNLEQSPHGAGRGRYVNELLRHLPLVEPASQFLLYTSGAPGADGLPPNANWRPLAGGPRWHLAAARAARRECDAFLSLSYVTSSFLDEYVQTVFDLIAFRGDGLAPAKSRRIERLTLRRAVRRARAILTISEATAADLAALVPEAAGKTTVTPLAADPRFTPDPPEDEVERVRDRLTLPAAYVLATGTIEPRKNYVRLVRAHAALPDELRRAYPLVVAGRRGWDYEPIVAALAAAADPPVRLLDFVADADLAVLYAGATVFCYPSLYEGFGLPVLEAMQAGAPVMTSNVSSLPEVGGDAVRYVDPYDDYDLRTALLELLADEEKRARLRAAGLERVKLFSWERTAEVTMAVVRAATARA
jgi:glycosyltransferase involved in cell wall biosynthesis